MTKKIKGIITALPAWLGSRRFFYGVLLFFIVEGVWIACSARYPMAFDEDFHMGIIKIYSYHWLPFLAEQPDNANQFGALARDPSYLYHYLMSFPYRLVALVTGNEGVQVFVLRLLNVAFAASSFVLFRRLLIRVGMSRPFTHTALALFALVPIMPLLAGQVNYDNLLLPFVAWMCLLAVDVYTALRKQQVELAKLGLLGAVCMAAALIKYAFLPLAAVTVALMFVGVLQGFWGQGGKTFLAAVAAGWHGVARRVRWVLLVALVLLGGLFVQRYGVNTVVYHTPVPACDTVLDEQACRAYGPWLRNHELARAKAETDTAPLAYTWHWLQALHYRLFFMVNGPYDDFRNYPPVPLPSATAVLIAVSGLVACVLYGRRLFAGRPLLVYLCAMSLFYAAVLWAEDYSQFIETGQPVAINGRYLIPVLLPLAAVLGRALHLALACTPRFKAGITVFVLLMFLQGGGVFSFILRSDDTWYWQQPFIQKANRIAQDVVSHIMVPGAKYYN